MKRVACLPAIVLLALAAGVSTGHAFSTVTSDEFPAAARATPLADPEDIVNDMANQQSNGAAIVNSFGGTTLGIQGPSGGGLAQGPFVPDPAVTTVPSKREGW
jgi:hypothetical protein